MFTGEAQIRVRYAETDQMGYAYYGNFSTYYEVARVEVLRAAGISYKAMEDEGVMMPIIENNSKYLSPAHYDDLLTVKVSIKEKPGIRIRFNYEIYNQNDILIHTGETLLVFVDAKTRKPRFMPESMQKIINQYFDEK